MRPSFAQRMSLAQLRQLQLLQLRYATETRSNTPNGPAPHKRLKPLYKRIDDFIVATYCTKDLSTKDSYTGLLKALDLLKEARVIVATQPAQMNLNKPMDTKSMVSQIWDEIH
jgi:hypothetical protein